MNIISKSHKRFSERLINPRVLECPEVFLGENFESVLNFWLILDELFEEQLRVVNERYWDLYWNNRSELDKAIDLANAAAYEVIGEEYSNEAGWAAYVVTNSRAAYRVTLELIAMHKILEDHQQPLTFFPMFLDVL